MYLNLLLGREHDQIRMFLCKHSKNDQNPLKIDLGTGKASPLCLTHSIEV